MRAIDRGGEGEEFTSNIVGVESIGDRDKERYLLEGMRR